MYCPGSFTYLSIIFLSRSKLMVLLSFISIFCDYTFYQYFQMMVLLGYEWMDVSSWWKLILHGTTWYCIAHSKDPSPCLPSHRMAPSLRSPAAGDLLSVWTYAAGAILSLCTHEAGSLLCGMYTDCMRIFCI